MLNDEKKDIIAKAVLTQGWRETHTLVFGETKQCLDLDEETVSKLHAAQCSATDVRQFLMSLGATNADATESTAFHGQMTLEVPQAQFKRSIEPNITPKVMAASKGL